MAADNRFSEMYHDSYAQDTYLGINTVIGDANRTAQDEGCYPINIISDPETPLGNLGNKWVNILSILGGVSVIAELYAIPDSEARGFPTRSDSTVMP